MNYKGNLPLTIFLFLHLALFSIWALSLAYRLSFTQGPPEFSLNNDRDAFEILANNMKALSNSDLQSVIGSNEIKSDSIEGQLINAGNNHIVNLAKITKEYQDTLEKIGFNQLIYSQDQDFKSKEKLTSVKYITKKAYEAADVFKTDFYDLFDIYEKSIKEIEISEALKNDYLDRLSKTKDQSKFERFFEIQYEAIALVDEYLSFLNIALIEISDEGIYIFSDDEDIAEYDNYNNKLSQLTAEEAMILQENKNIYSKVSEGL